ncbi:alpha-glucan family phosphorylase, partial [candidate division KSB1 bacterium]
KKLMLLKEIIYNLLWCWDHEAINLMRRIDEELWEEKEHNPILMLGNIKQERLDSLTENEGFIAQMERVNERMKEYLSEKTWFEKTWNSKEKMCIAYFSAEFGISECMPIYSGGLGILAGDHLKSASELGLPLVGVGLMYQEGYFRQYLNSAGWQGERYPTNDFYNMPMTLATDKKGNPVTIEVEFPGRNVTAQIWEIKVGRVVLYALDTNIPQNNQGDKNLTSELYGGDKETRIQQEILLGIGGIRALKKLKIDPCVCHMNEGHSAFLALERIRIAISEHGLTFPEALELSKAGNVFTTHTPVPAGIDKFSPELVDKYFSSYYPKLQISRDEFLALGRENEFDSQAEFSMAVLAIKLANFVNGVSKLHGDVSRKMWHNVFPGIPDTEVPISSVTNGIHYRSWISGDMADLYLRYLGPRWLKEPADQTIWERIDQIPAEELWKTHERRRERMVAFARGRLVKQLKTRGAMSSEIAFAEEVMNPDTLTIGFARRFATYKRASLIFKNIDRLVKILLNKERPVQIIFAGKAHPKDTPGKELIQKIVQFARQEDIRRHVVFIEDYDINVSRYLVQGVDVWLNTPMRPYEASGTSGMKATANGVINLSILDGWWDEAYSPETGWAIGKGETYDDPELQNEVESNAIYALLEKEIVPLFYERGRDGLPRGWIDKMKSSMRHLCPVFNTNRMVSEYFENFYMPTAVRHKKLKENEMVKVKDLAHWKSFIKENWESVKILDVKSEAPQEVSVGTSFEVHASVHLGNIKPEDVQVEIYFGAVNSKMMIVDAEPVPMTSNGNHNEGNHEFIGKVVCKKSGKYGYSLRIRPNHEDMNNPFETGLIIWSN